MCYFAGGVLGIDLTEVPAMLSQGEDFTHFNITQLKNMVSNTGIFQMLPFGDLFIYTLLFFFSVPLRSPFPVNYMLAIESKYQALLSPKQKIQLGERTTSQQSCHLLMTVVLNVYLPRFLSYHCLLYPQVNWCQNKTLHVYRS